MSPIGVAQSCINVFYVHTEIKLIVILILILNVRLERFQALRALAVTLLRGRALPRCHIIEISVLPATRIFAAETVSWDVTMDRQ
jgi:hypothetical protein